MGYQDIDYLRVKKNLDNGYIHLKRIDEAIEEIEEKYRFPINKDKLEKIF